MKQHPFFVPMRPNFASYSSLKEAINMLGSEDRQSRAIAHDTLVKAGARAVVPLLKACPDGKCSYCDILPILAKIGQPAEMPLRNALSDSNETVRKLAIDGLCRLAVAANFRLALRIVSALRLIAQAGITPLDGAVHTLARFLEKSFKMIDDYYRLSADWSNGPTLDDIYGAHVGTAEVLESIGTNEARAALRWKHAYPFAIT